MEAHNPPVFCAQPVGVVPAESINIESLFRQPETHNVTVSWGRNVRMGLISVDPAIWHLQCGPAADCVQPPEIIVATEKVITPLADLFLLHTIL